ARGGCPVACKPRARHLASCMISRICTLPCFGNSTVVNRCAVTTSDSLESLRKQLVQVGSRDVQIRSVDIAVKPSTYNGHCFRRPVQSEQRFAELVIHASESIAWGVDRASKM